MRDLTTCRRRRSRAIGLVAMCALALLAAGCDSFASKEERIAQARADIAAGNYAAARLELKRVLESSPDDAAARLALAEASLSLGDVQAADTELRRAISAGGPSGATAVLEAQIMLATDDATRLLSRLNAGELPAPEPDRSIFKGAALLALGQAAAAQEVYGAVRNQHPDEVRATTGLALSLAAQGQDAQAIELVSGYVKQHPHAGEAWLTLGDLQSRASRYSEAETALRVATSAKAQGLTVPQQMAALMALGEAQLARGARDDAKATLARMRKLADGSTPVRLMSARLALSEQDYSTAVDELQPLVAAMPDLASAQFLLGVALFGKGNVAQAEGHLSEALRLAPENIEVRKQLARARIKLQRYDAALQVLSPAMQTDSQDPELAALLSETKLRSGAPDEAIAVLERSASQHPDDTGIKLDLATVYIAAGRNDEAINLLRSLPEVKGATRREELLVTALAAAKGPAEARSEMERLVARHPKDVEILVLAAAQAVSQAEYGIARTYLQKALVIEPRNANALQMLAMTEVRAGSLDAADVTLRRLVELPGMQTVARLWMAEVSLMRGKPSDARSILEQARKDDAKAIEARLLLARLMLQATESGPASKVLAEVVAIDPADARLRLRVARLLGQFGRYDEATRQAQLAAEMSPEIIDAWLELARMQIALGRLEPARQSAGKAVALDPGSTEAVGILALLDLREKKGEAALARVRELSARLPHDAVAAALEGDVRMALGQPREAETAYARGYSLRPGLQLAAKQSSAMVAAGMPNPVLPLERWVSDHPADGRGRMALADAYLSGNQKAKAIEQYERLQAARGVGFVVFNNLAWLYSETGDPRAEATARRALDLAPDNPSVLDTAGWILVQNGNVPEGLTLLSRAAEKAPDNFDILYHYAAALAKSGDRARAAAMLERALRPGTRFDSRPAAEQLRATLAAGDAAAN